LLHPELPRGQFEEVVDEDRAGGTPRIDMLIRLGLGDVKKIWYCREAIRDPQKGVRNPTSRPYASEVLEKLIDTVSRSGSVQSSQGDPDEAGQDPRGRRAAGRRGRF
jgi:hypothetical protein